MDMEGALRARLLAAPAVTGLAQQRVYWENRPQGSALPAIVLDMVTDIRDQTLGGFQSLLAAHVQASVYALSFAEKKQLKEAVIAAIAPQSEANGIWFDPATEIAATPRNEQVETQYIYADLIDFTVHYRPV